MLNFFLIIKNVLCTSKIPQTFRTQHVPPPDIWKFSTTFPPFPHFKSISPTNLIHFICQTTTHYVLGCHLNPNQSNQVPGARQQAPNNVYTSSAPSARSLYTMIFSERFICCFCFITVIFQTLASPQDLARCRAHQPRRSASSHASSGFPS